MYQNIYSVIVIVVLLILATLFSRKLVRREITQLSYTAALGFSFIIAGIVFGENRVLGYSLMGIGLVLAIIDAAGQMKRRMDKG